MPNAAWRSAFFLFTIALERCSVYYSVLIGGKPKMTITLLVTPITNFIQNPFGRMVLLHAYDHVLRFSLISYIVCSSVL